MTSRPWRSSSFARASTENAVSVPSRERLPASPAEKDVVAIGRSLRHEPVARLGDVAKVEDKLGHLRVPAEDEASQEVRNLWAKPLEKGGFIPNVLRSFALREEHLL